MIRHELGVPPGSVSLRKIDTTATPGAPKQGKTGAIEARSTIGDELADLQERLMAEALVGGSKRRVLVVLQGMDCSGKDGVVKRGFGGMNPKWLRITGFGKPTEEELAHHFLWRIRRALPEPGQIGVFDRSHYEDVIAVRARKIVGEDVWRPRFAEINAFERKLAEDGCTIVKVFLHISSEYQLDRQLRRLDRVDKRWKFDEADLEDRKLWPQYQAAYEEAIGLCNTPAAPWFVVPGDHKWYRGWAVSQLLLETLRELDPQFPARKELDIPKLKRKLKKSL
jgi:PPK2 family polyphosphate:nucleotide phosphotransferase